ncbi:MAG: ribosomal protein S18-alanine N-acetyltransferase [Lachnospiraceae bacterium]
MISESFKILPMTILDIEKVAAIEAISFTQPWSEKAFCEMLKSDRAHYVVARIEDEVVGMCGLLYSFEEAEVSNVAVLPTYRGRGVAKRMLEELLNVGSEQGVEAFCLEVRASNEAAISLYKSTGFEIAALRKNCYAHPTEDGYVMWKRK